METKANPSKATQLHLASFFTPDYFKANSTISKRILRHSLPLIDNLLCLPQLRDVYLKALVSGSAKEDFSRETLRVFGVSYDVTTTNETVIPKEGPVIVVANHPFGGVEGLILFDLLQKSRKNIKLLANSMLLRFEPLRELVIPVDPFEGRQSVRDNIRSMREAHAWLSEGNVLGVFPSGTVSHYQRELGGVADPPWRNHIARLVQETGAQVVPIFFDGKNPWTFHAAGFVHPLLRTALLPRQLVNKGGKNIRVEVGNPISTERLQTFSDSESLMQYLRFRTYALSNRNPPSSSIQRSIGRPHTSASAKVEPIAKPISSDILASEVLELEKIQEPLGTVGSFKVFLATREKIPNITLEIGRLRELSFRGVGQGTGKARDLDRFDDYYDHLFSWDAQKNQIVGAYRVGRTDSIIAEYGVRGLYTYSLFDYSEVLFSRLGPSLELGRSFIVPSYQKSHFALLLLWKGIGRIISEDPRYRHLFGLVSVSGNYKSASQQLMLSYLLTNKFLSEYSTLVRARNAPTLEGIPGVEKAKIRMMINNFDDLSKIISELEVGGRTVPVLIRQYLKLDGAFLGFNIDQDFNNTLDGLILVDLMKSDPKVLTRYLGAGGLEDFYQYQLGKEKEDRLQVPA